MNELLTPRQREVLALAAGGLRNGHIAAVMGVSPRTVDSHMRNVFGRLGVRSRTGAVMWALRRGEIPLEGGTDELDRRIRGGPGG